VRRIALAALAAAALAGPLAVPAAAGPTRAAVDYLAGRQAASGCYAEPGGGPSPELTAWVAMGLRAVRAPVPAGARLCLARSARSARVPTDAQRTLLGLVAAGGDPRRDGGVDLVARVRGQIRRDGSVPPTVNASAFAALALRAAGAPVPASVPRAIRRAQQRSGAWGLGGLPDSNITAAAIEALVATGSGARSRPVNRGVAALARFRHPGGYGLTPGSPPDAQSTAWAVQALVAAGRDPSAALTALRRLQRPDGSFAYRRGQAITPVWVTAQALPALARRPLPIR
jgi:Prenyltransferase and squalene oxidase repeat